MTHTPTPWKAGALNPMTGKKSIYHDYLESNFTNGIGVKRIASCLAYSDSRQEQDEITTANAELIVKAVNNHEALVEVLTDLLGTIEAYELEGEIDAGTDDSGACLRARAILAKVKEAV